MTTPARPRPFADGASIIVGANHEQSNASAINGDQTSSGAVYAS